MSYVDTSTQFDRQRPVAPAEDIESPVDTLRGDWWVVHTKSRHEKTLAWHLDQLGVGYFLPLAHTERIYGGRTFRVNIPLFPSYLFMCGRNEERYLTLTTHCAANVIPVVDQIGLKTQLRHIYRLMICKHPVNLHPRLKRGRRCRVTRGCLKGLEGVVVRRRGACRVYVAVDAIGQSAELEIDASLLEVID